MKDEFTCHVYSTKTLVDATGADIVKSSMKNRSGTYGKTRKTLPLEGGGKSPAPRRVQDDALNLTWFGGWG